jgi:hypothetical protein
MVQNDGAEMSPKTFDQALTELACVPGREAVAGPLQEMVEVVIRPGALVVRRGRILQTFRGGRSEKVIEFGQIARVTEGGAGGVTIVPKPDANIGPSRTLHGIAAATVLAAWWASMGSVDARLMSVPASYQGALGVARSGIVLAGPGGVVFVPTGWTGAVEDTLVRIPHGFVEGVRQTRPGQYQLMGEYAGELHLESTLEHLAVLLSRVLDQGTSAPRVGGIVALPVVWQLEGREAWRSVVSIAGSHLSLSVPGADVEPLSVAGGQVERLKVVLSGPTPQLVCRIAGEVHTLRPLGAASGLRRLDAMLQGACGDVDTPMVDLFRWRRLVGLHRVARLFRGASAEGVLEGVEIKVSASGIRLRGRPRTGVLSAEQFSPGTRIRVTLPKGRGWQQFVGTVRNLVHELGPGASIVAVDLLLLPVADGPKVGAGRRSYHRVSFAAPLSFPIRRLRLVEGEWFAAEMLDLSAGGFAARVSRPMKVGDRFRVDLPTREWSAPMEAEIVHCRAVRGASDVWMAGFRLLGVTEKHRSMLQREVLRLERVQLAGRRNQPEIRATGTADTLPIVYSNQ